MKDTKYYKTWEQYEAEHPEINEKRANAMANKMQEYEDRMFSFILALLM